MYFPSDHAYPTDLPAWLVAGHAFDAVGITDDAQMERGEDLARQIYTWVPQIASVSTILEQPQFDRLDLFYERDLRAGTRRFDTRVAAQGGTGMVWWTAQFIGPYQWEGMHRNQETGENRYRVTAALLLLDGPHATREDVSLRGHALVTTTLTARSAAFVLRGRALVTTTLRLVTDAPTYITEGGDDLITEDEEILELES
jgi:hypothetical protein